MKLQLSNHHHHHRLLLLVSSLLIFSSTTSVQSRRTLQENCSSSCGDITINYPFRLTTDPQLCGDPDYELSCQNNQTLLNFHSGKYFIKQINYLSHMIRLVDFNLASENCSLPYSSLSVDDLRDGSRYRGSVSTTFTSFFKCSNESKDPSYREIPCLIQNGSMFHFYVTYGNYIISGLQGPCSFVSRVPTIYQAVLNPSYDSIVKLMASGFDLEWSLECRDCVNGGGSCFLSSVGTPNVYECQGRGIYLPPIVTFFFAAVSDIALVINLIARFVLAPIVIIGFLVHKRRTTKKTKHNKEINLSNQQSLIPRRYSYSDLIEITNNFKDKLGKGGFGTLFKGQLADSYVVAVKMLGESKFSNDDFTNEVSIFGKIHHVNVAKLVGFCSEESHHALVFEYLANGSLDKFIFSRGPAVQPLSWEIFLGIAIGTARGIEHLHVGCDVCILHFDIKPHNVLLDSNFIPKVSDFGLAKFYPKEYDFVSISTRRGTLGYIAPELISTNLRSVSCKSDVYSFGMLLLEMARGRIKIDATENNLERAYFASWVYEHLNEGGELEVENSSEIEVGIAKKICIVGLWCIQKNASDRPLMTKVVEMLEGNDNGLHLPPSPFSFPDYIPTEDPQSDSSTELLISESVEHRS
ncbi:Protein kinase family protein [Euphorbia peplus]|nr:Protein kinase family protein [Euphorbia peplus]